MKSTERQEHTTIVCGRHGSRSALCYTSCWVNVPRRLNPPPYLNHSNIWNSLSTDANWKTVARKLCRQSFKISSKMTFRECISEPYIHVALGQALSPGFSLYMHFANILLNPTTWNPTPRSQALQDERHQTCVKAFLYQVKLNVKTWETPAGRLHHTCVVARCVNHVLAVYVHGRTIKLSLYMMRATLGLLRYCENHWGW